MKDLGLGIDISKEERMSVLGVSLIWVRGIIACYRKLPISVLREICDYSKTSYIIDVHDGVLFVHGMETMLWRRSLLNIKEKGRPPLLIVKGTVYLFSCGPSRKAYIGTWTHRILLGEEERLADSLLSELRSPGPLYDDDMNYCYLFGGITKSRKLNVVQVYDPEANIWTR